MKVKKSALGYQVLTIYEMRVADPDVFVDHSATLFAREIWRVPHGSSGAMLSQGASRFLMFPPQHLMFYLNYISERSN